MVIDIRMAPKFAMHNKASLELTKQCCCYYCFKRFDVKEIKEYTDWEKDTAICPYCSIDAVLPIYSEEDVMNLEKIHNYWCR